MGQRVGPKPTKPKAWFIRDTINWRYCYEKIRDTVRIQSKHSSENSGARTHMFLKASPTRWGPRPITLLDTSEVEPRGTHIPKSRNLPGGPHQTSDLFCSDDRVVGDSTSSDYCLLDRLTIIDKKLNKINNKMKGIFKF